MSFFKRTSLLPTLLALALTGLSLQGFAQAFEHKNYDWEEEPKPFVLPDELKDEQAVIVHDHYFDEFIPRDEGEKSFLRVHHERTFINSDKALEANNRIYVPITRSGKLMSMKARVIQADGTVKLLDKSDIKKGVDEDSGVEYNYYAVEGLKVGSEVEHFTVINRTPEFYGSIFYLTDRYPVMSYIHEYKAPDYLSFGFKSYNTEEKIKVEELDDERTMYSIALENIPKRNEEPMSYDKVNSPHYIFKLDKNTSTGSSDINSWGNISQIFGERCLNFEQGKGEMKKIAKLYKTIGVDESADDASKALAIENYIKSNFAHYKQSSPELQDINFVLTNKAFNDYGAHRLYRELLNLADIENGIVLTCDKSKHYFDEDFETYLTLDKSFIYLKKLNSCIDFTAPAGRQMFYNVLYQGHQGLYIESRNIGGNKMATGKVIDIPISTATQNITRGNITVDIEGDFDEIDINIEKEVNGMVALSFQPYFSQIEESNLEDFYRFVVQSYGDQVKLSTLEFENIESGDFPVKPLKYSFQVADDDFWEKGGKTYILNVGALIGPQSEMYFDDKKERQNPINSFYARAYQYTLTFPIPENFEATNLDDLNIDIDGRTNEIECYFKSSYEVKGDKVIVTIDEMYDSASYPAEYFDTYRNVINAASDFNKVKIIFKPK